MNGLDASGSLPVSVVIPTIGRPDQLFTTLEILAECRPLPAEIVIVDQSEVDATASVVEQFTPVGAVRLRSAGRGVGLALNEGLRLARNEAVLITDDDCSVAPDWISTGARLAASGGIATGAVLPLGDPNAIPSTKTDTEPQDY